jgi:3-hydroxybutyryl-CoA dehydrogenase
MAAAAPRAVKVIGCGRTRARIAQSFTAAGFSATVVENGEDVAAATLERIESALRRASTPGRALPKATRKWDCQRWHSRGH